VCGVEIGKNGLYISLSGMANEKNVIYVKEVVYNHMFLARVGICEVYIAGKLKIKCLMKEQPFLVHFWDNYITFLGEVILPCDRVVSGS
jgi:hypothetical protein